MDRVLGVLDGAVLVISAVEGVQPQTRVLMRALRRLRVPSLLFVNKIDRPGADVDRVLAEIRRRLAVAAVPMSRVQRAGSRDAWVDAAPRRRPAGYRRARRPRRAAVAAYVEDEAGLTRRGCGPNWRRRPPGRWSIRSTPGRR